LQNSTDVKSGTARTIVLIKAAPIIGQKHGETVCCAGIDVYGKWHRMYPVSFRLLEDAKRFGRWDIVTYNWRRPTDDDRIESRHVNSQSLEISGCMKKAERANFLDNHIVTSLNVEAEAGRSLALLRPTIKEFVINPKFQSEVAAEQRKIDNYHAQSDMFAPPPGVPRVACPYDFKYKYSTDDGDRTGTCQDWETEATFYKWRDEYGEKGALTRMQETYGHTLPQRGLYFAMGTHSLHRETWLINGLVQLRATKQPSLF
jgi:hypothetical protein